MKLNELFEKIEAEQGEDGESNGKGKGSGGGQGEGGSGGGGSGGSGGSGGDGSGGGGSGSSVNMNEDGRQEASFEDLENLKLVNIYERPRCCFNHATKLFIYSIENYR